MAASFDPTIRIIQSLSVYPLLCDKEECSFSKGKQPAEQHKHSSVLYMKLTCLGQDSLLSYADSNSLVVSIYKDGCFCPNILILSSEEFQTQFQALKQISLEKGENDPTYQKQLDKVQKIFNQLAEVGARERTNWSPSPMQRTLDQA